MKELSLDRNSILIRDKVIIFINSMIITVFIIFIANIVTALHMMVASGNETIAELAAGSCLSALWVSYTHTCHQEHHQRHHFHSKTYFHNWESILAILDYALLALHIKF